MIYVYTLIDPVTDKVRYVGLSRRPKDRLIQHFHAKSNPHKQRWLRKLKHLGLMPQMRILARVSKDLADKVEQAFIIYYKDERLLNATSGGELGFKHTSETKRKVGENSKRCLTGRKIPEERRLRMKATLQGRRLNPHPSYFSFLNKQRIGIPLTEEHKRKVSLSLVGRKLSISQRKKLSEIKKKQWQDPEYRAKILPKLVASQFKSKATPATHLSS